VDHLPRRQARRRALDGSLRELRRWGVGFLSDPTADGASDQHFDVTYVRGIHGLADGEFELTVDGEPTTYRFTGGRLHQRPGPADAPEPTVRTTAGFREWVLIAGRDERRWTTLIEEAREFAGARGK